MARRGGRRKRRKKSVTFYFLSVEIRLQGKASPVRWQLEMVEDWKITTFQLLRVSFLLERNHVKMVTVGILKQSGNERTCSPIGSSQLRLRSYSSSRIPWTRIPGNRISLLPNHFYLPTDHPLIINSAQQQTCWGARGRLILLRNPKGRNCFDLSNPIRVICSSESQLTSLRRGSEPTGCRD